jgi:hypothetical protein
MDARPLLEEIAEQFAIHHFDAVLIGNAAAALQGAPVTTIDFDFYMRETARNEAKLQSLARSLNASVSQPFLPGSAMYRITRAKDDLQIDFLADAHGIKSFESLRSRSEWFHFGKGRLRVASLRDIIESKRAAGRTKDLASLTVLEATYEIKKASGQD